MKNLVIICILLFYSVCLAQVQYDEEGKIFYEQVFPVENVTKKELKSRVNEWVALNFKDANNVIKMNTEDKIVAKGLIKVPYEFNGMKADYEIDFDLIADFKDGRYKVLMDNLKSKPLPYLHLYQDLSLEQFKLITMEIANKMGTSKQMKKMIEKDSFYDQYYLQAKEMHRDHLNKLANKLNSIAENIKLAVQQGGTDDDW